MPSPLKIGLYVRYHSKTPCKVCPKQFAAYPGTPERIRADCITLSCRSRSEQPCTVSARTGTALSYRPRRNDSALCNPAPTDTDQSRNAWTNHADRISSERSHQAGAAFHGQPVRIFHGSPVRGVCSRCNALLFAMHGKCFLRLFCADFSELHIMYICGNTETNENRAFASFLQVRGISD